MNPSDDLNGLDIFPFRSPEGRDQFLSEAGSHLEENRCQEALSLARERIDLFPGDADARMICGITLARMGRTGEALEVFEKIAEDVLHWARVFEYLGDMTAEKGDIDRARNFYQTLMYLHPDPSVRERLSGKIEALGGDEEGSEETPADQIAGDFKTMTMAELYIRQGHLDMAENVLKDLLHGSPDDVRAAKRLREVEELLAKKMDGSTGARPNTALHELSRWLRNLKRLQNNA